MEMIEFTPPGLYEAIITDVGGDTENRNLVDGKYLFRLESAHSTISARSASIAPRMMSALKLSRAFRDQSRPLSHVR